MVPSVGQCCIEVKSQFSLVGYSFMHEAYSYPCPIRKMYLYSFGHWLLFILRFDI